MPNDDIPPGAPHPPEIELAHHVIEYTCLQRVNPGRFLRDYRDTRDRFWALLYESVKLGAFGSDFFDDLLTLLGHPDIARDAPADATERLLEVHRLRSLRRLEGGDVAGGLAAILPSGDADAKGVHETLAELGAEPGADRVVEPVLTPAFLTRLADGLDARDPERAAAVRALLPHLQADRNSWSGPHLAIVFHMTSGGSDLHPGYGVAANLELEAAALDRLDRSILRIGGVRLPPNAHFGEHIWNALRGANTTSRSMGDPDLMHGIDFDFHVHGIPGHPTGESAGLGFALLALWIGGSVVQRRQGEPLTGTAAIGVVHPDGSVHEVFDGSLGPKLRRLRESCVRRLYVPATQGERCRELVAAEPRPEIEKAGFARRVDVIGVGGVPRVVAPHFVSRRPAAWLGRVARRNRLPIFLGGALVAIAIAASMLVDVSFGLRDVHRDGAVVTAEYRWGRPRTVQLTDSLLLAPPAVAEPVRRDLDGDGSPEIVIVSMQVPGPGATSGRVRLDVLDDRLRHRFEPRFVETKLELAGGQTFSTHELTPEILDMEDWDGDGRSEIFVASNGLYFPSVVSIWDAQGELRGEFVNPGHVKFMLVVPGPGPRHDLLLLAACAESHGCMLARLPCEFGSAAFPSENPRARVVGLEAPDEALFVKLLPSLPRLVDPGAQTWPGGLAWLPGSPTPIQVSTLEFAPDASLQHRFDERLRSFGVSASTAFQTYWRQHEQAGTVPPLDDPKVVRAIETVRRWEKGVWTEEGSGTFQR